MHRHGSRHPLGNDFPNIANLSAKLNDPVVAKQIDSLDLPAEWRFIQGPDRWVNTLQLNDLTVVGRQENFVDGVKWVHACRKLLKWLCRCWLRIWRFRLSYPSLTFKHIISLAHDRVRIVLQWTRKKWSYFWVFKGRWISGMVPFWNVRSGCRPRVLSVAGSTRQSDGFIEYVPRRLQSRQFIYTDTFVSSKLHHIWRVRNIRCRMAWKNLSNGRRFISHRFKSG